jgi:hypothetical protein
MNRILNAPRQPARRVATAASRSVASVLVALSIAAGSARADRVVTTDGRILSPQKARAEGDGYKFVFENGEIVLPDKSLVREVEIEGDMSDYTPANDDEKQKLAQGFVRYRGKWMSAQAYREELKKNFEASKKRTEEIRKHSDWSDAWTKETQHFKFKCNASPELLDYYSELLETYYNLQDQRIGINPPPNIKRQKMTVNIYRSNDDFHKYAAAPDIGPSVLGYFWAADNTLNFYHEYQEPSLSTWVALHECTHLLTYLIEPQYDPQIWLNEAVADYFGSSKVTRNKAGKLVIEPGQLQTDRVLTVQQALKDSGAQTGDSAGGKEKRGFEGRPFTKLEDLFMLSREAFDGFQYAHAWAFVYFLNNFDNGKYQKDFNRFFKGLYTLEKGVKVQPTPRGKMVAPKDIRDMLLKRLGVKDVPQLEADWRKFVADIPIIGPEARLKRGIYGVREFELEQAITDLTAAIDGGVTDPRAWAYRAKAYAFTGKMELGLADAKKAIELDPLDAAYRYEYSQMMVGMISSGSAHEGGGVSFKAEGGEGKIKDEPEAKKQACLAAELDPENDRFREWSEEFE